QAANRELAWLTLCDRLEERAQDFRRAAIDATEAERRRTRQKSRGQKRRMVEGKRREARRKAGRGRVSGW
ncbi:MAG: peptide chain release factor-like protein, partial [Opitutaceae bacterium]